jgi:hypothetical protein
MASCKDIRPQLSEFVDGALTSDARADVEEHLAICAACAALARDLDRVRAAASQLGPIAPPEHIWLEIAGQIRLGSPVASPSAPPAVRRQAVWQWLGLAAALLLITLGAYAIQRWPASRTSPSAAIATAPGNVPATGSVETLEQELRQAEQHYGNAIAELEAITKNGDSSMDPKVAETVRKNLTTIDHAIAESRAALTDDPANTPARESLFEALRRKVDVLQTTVLLMNEMRKGNPEGAARVAPGLGKKS